MKILFCNDIYPGIFGKMPARLASDSSNEVMFLSFYPRKEESFSGVIHARLNLSRNRDHLPQSRDIFVAEWEKMFSLGKQAMQTFLHIRDTGFIPDIIFVSFFDGPAFFLRHVFPQAFIVSLFRGFHSRTEKDDVRFEAVMDLQKMMLTQSNLYFVRSEVQKRYFPSSLHSLIHVWQSYVDTEFFSPQPRNLSIFFPESSDAENELVTVHMKTGGDLSRKMMRLVLGLLMNRPRCLVALMFGGDTSRDRWKRFCHTLPENLHRRLFLAGGLEHTAYRDLLCSSTVHIFPEHINPPLQEMLECMSCGTLLMTPLSDETDGLLQDGRTMIAFPENEQRQMTAICRVLDHKEEFDDLRRNARKKIVENCSEQKAITGQVAFIMKEYEKYRKT